MINFLKFFFSLNFFLRDCQACPGNIRYRTRRSSAQAGHYTAPARFSSSGTLRFRSPRGAGRCGALRPARRHRSLELFSSFRAALPAPPRPGRTGRGGEGAAGAAGATGAAGSYPAARRRPPAAYPSPRVKVARRGGVQRALAAHCTARGGPAQALPRPPGRVKLKSSSMARDPRAGNFAGKNGKFSGLYENFSTF